MATIGMWPPVSRSWLRIAAVASKPPISGICTSIRMMSKVLGRSLRNRLPAVADAVTSWPRCFEQQDHQLLVGGVVFGDEDAERPVRGGAGRARGRRPRGRRAARLATNAFRIASSRSECFTGLISCAEMLPPWRARARAAGPRRSA